MIVKMEPEMKNSCLTLPESNWENWTLLHNSHFYPCVVPVWKTKNMEKLHNDLRLIVYRNVLFFSFFFSPSLTCRAICMYTKEQQNLLHSDHYRNQFLYLFIYLFIFYKIVKKAKRAAWQNNQVIHYINMQKFYVCFGWNI